MENLPEFEIGDPSAMREFLEEAKVEISLLTFNAVKKAVDEDAMYMPVMRIKMGDLPLAIITVKREHFDTSLQKCLENLQEAEYYEECAEIVKLLKDERLK
jgi:hypothetical protein